MRRRLLAAVLLLVLAGCAPVLEGQAKGFNQGRVTDAVRDYEAARQGGALLDMCVRAGQVLAAYVDLDDPNGTAWRARRDEDCAAARAQLDPAVEPQIER